MLHFVKNVCQQKQKGLKTINHNKNEVLITGGYRNWHHETENFRVHQESHCCENYVSQLYPP